MARARGVDGISMCGTHAGVSQGCMCALCSCMQTSHIRNMYMNNRAGWQEINKRRGTHSSSRIIYSSEATSHFCLIPSLAFLLAPRRLKVYMCAYCIPAVGACPGHPNTRSWSNNREQTARETENSHKEGTKDERAWKRESERRQRQS